MIFTSLQSNLAHKKKSFNIYERWLHHTWAIDCLKRNLMTGILTKFHYDFEYTYSWFTSSNKSETSILNETSFREYYIRWFSEILNIHCNDFDFTGMNSFHCILHLLHAHAIKSKFMSFNWVLFSFLVIKSKRKMNN